MTTGFAKVEAAIASGKIAALIHAVDGAPDGKRKLRQALAPPLRRPHAAGLSTCSPRTSSIPRSAAAMWFTLRLDLARRQRFFSLPHGDLRYIAATAKRTAPLEGQDLTMNEALEQGFKADGANGRDSTWDA